MHDVTEVTRNSTIYFHQEANNFLSFQQPLIISFLNRNYSVNSGPNDSKQEDQFVD